MTNRRPTLPMIRNPAILALAALVLLGCATPEYKNARNECASDAFRQHPINNVVTVVTATRAVQVPTGQTHCTTTYVGNQAFSQCQQVMRTEYVPYQKNAVVDANARPRENAMTQCAAQLCLGRFGNVECKAR